MKQEVIDAIVASIMQGVRNEISPVAETVNELKSSTAAIAVRLDNLEGSIIGIKREIEEQKGRVSDLSTALDGIVKDIANELVLDAVTMAHDSLKNELQEFVSAGIQTSVASSVGDLSDGVMSYVEQEIGSQLKSAVEALPAPPEPIAAKDGKDGVGITSMSDDGQVLTFGLSNGEHFIVKHGVDGKNGESVRGEPGKDGNGIASFVDIGEGFVVKMVDGSEITLMHGRDGNDGKSIKGEDGKDGADGVSLVEAAIDREGSLLLITSKGETKNLGLVVGHDAKGRDGIDGDNGRDGFGFDDLTVEHDGERNVSIKFVRGDVEKSFPLKIPAVIHRGFYVKDAGYEHGDMVTYAGSSWIAKTDTSSLPVEGSSHWMLAAKQGMTGKSVKGEKGKDGKDGEKGRDLTQVGSRGEKW